MTDYIIKTLVCQEKNPPRKFSPMEDTRFIVNCGFRIAKKTLRIDKGIADFELRISDSMSSLFGCFAD